MARTWGGIKHTLVATTHVTSSWVRAVHLVQVDQAEGAGAVRASRRGQRGKKPVQVFDPFFALQLLQTLAYLQAGKVPPLIGMLQGLARGRTPGKPAGSDPEPQTPMARGTARYMAASFIGGPTCVYPFSDERDYNVLRSAPSVGKAFHQHYYRKGRGLAYYQISAEAARSTIF